MSQQQIGVGSAPNDGQGETLRDAMIKANENFTDSETRLQKSDLIVTSGDGDKFLSDTGGYTAVPQSGTTTMRAESGTSAPPSSGKVRWNNSDQISATILFLSKTNDVGSDLTNYLSSLAVGDAIYFQDAGDAGHFQTWEVISIADNGSYKTISVAFLGNAGGNFSTTGQGQHLLMTIRKGGGSLQQLQTSANATIVVDSANRTDNMNAWMAGAVSTGILTGGVVTPNANPLLFDISAGTGLIIDWTGPQAPQRKYIKWAALIGETVPNFASQFTSLFFNAAGALTKDPGAVPDGNDYRSRIYLQSVIHQSGTQVDSVSSGGTPAYEVIAALFDYVRFVGPANKGNCFAPNGVSTTFIKEVGQTALPFINRANDLQNPTVQTDALISPVTNFTQAYRDGSGGTTFIFPNSVIDSGFWDDGTGVLNSVTNNRFTLKRIYWFPQSGSVTVTVGQAEYANLVDARAALQTENAIIDPLITNNGSFTATLIVQEGATDLSDPAQAEFICMNPI